MTSLERPHAAEVAERVREWRRKRRAVIFAHNYQLPEVQDIADFVGDSLAMAFGIGSCSTKSRRMPGLRSWAKTSRPSTLKAKRTGFSRLVSWTTATIFLS